MFDRTVRMYDEGYPPEKLDEFIKKGDIHKGAFLKDKFHDSHYLLMRIVDDLKVKSVLEIGPGEGAAGRYMRSIGIQWDTVDWDKNNNPTIVGNIEDLDVNEYQGKYDIVCAMQVLEHLPYERFGECVKKMHTMSERYVLISLPYHCFGFSLKLSIAVGQIRRTNKKISFYLPFCERNRKYRKEYMEEYPWAVHYWEIGRKGYSLKRIIRDIEAQQLRIVKRLHSDNPYHYFILAEKL